MGYQGEENRTQEDYIFDTIPYNPEFDLEQLNLIQNKLQSGYALSAEEATIFLDWITYNAREYAVSQFKIKGQEKPGVGIELHSMTGQCAPTQKINVELLRKFGLDARPFNTADCMGEIPRNQETDKRINFGHGSPNVRHSIAMVTIPIADENSNVHSYKFLLDPTFRQFCLKENCVEKEEWSQHGYGAPHTGYFMRVENLRQLGVSDEEAQKSELVGRYLVERGYLLLSEENARLYMNAFRRASIDKFNQGKLHEISGYEFISNFENTPMEMVENNKGNEHIYTRMPNEIIEQENKKNRTIFSKIKDLFKKIFNRNDIKALPQGNVPRYSEDKDPYKMFREQYEATGEIIGAEPGEVQQLDNIVRNNYNDEIVRNNYNHEIEIGDE